MAVTGYSTLRLFVYDLLEDIKQSRSEAKVGEYQMAFNVMLLADRLKKQHIQKMDSGAYLTPFTVDLYPDSTYLKEFDLPKSIYDYDGDRGIEYIMTTESYDEDRVKFTRTTAIKARRLYFRDDETPAYDNPYFYLEGNAVKLLGIDDEDVDEVEIGLYTTFNPADITVDLDAPFEFPQDLYPILKRQALDLVTWSLQVPENKRSDQVGNTETPPKKFLSVDDAINPQTSQD